MQKALTLFFTAPRQVEIRETTMPPLKEDEVLVETLCSAISAGTEMLIYRGQFSHFEEAQDSLSSNLAYPLPYGYACTGQIKAIGRRVDKSLQGKLVFAFHPHASSFNIHPSALIFIPASLSPETACFLPNMETAVNLVQDGAPILGERVLVIGQGMVGLLTAALLSEFPLKALATVDLFEARRKAFSKAGFQKSFDPNTVDFHERLKTFLNGQADLTFELSGAPAALNEAIALTRFSGRVVIGSWYGRKRAEIDLGGAFHRSRIKLISSQVSTIAPELSSRWDKARRFEVAWNALERIQPEKWTTQRFPLNEAAKAYQLLDENPGDTLQVIFDYTR